MENYYKLEHSKFIIIIIFLYLDIHIIIIKFTKNILNNYNYSQKNKTNKLCICTIGKCENNYIKEFIIHYIKFGVDKIFLYDNNNINDERFEEVINDYIKNGFVQIFNFRGLKQPQHKFMNDCYKRNYQKYDWLIFYDIDEFIYLHNYKNIKKFLNQKKFNNCEVICLNWIEHTDNNKLYYENKSLVERFKQIQKLNKKGKKYPQVKPILRGHISNIRIKHLHTINNNFTKSTEEFIKKLNRGDDLFLNSTLIRIRKYFEINRFSQKKLEMIENATGLNLYKYKILYSKKRKEV